MKIMNGGRKKWEMEGRAYTKDDPVAQKPQPQSTYVTQPPDENRAYLPDVKRAIERAETVLVDVPSPKEFSGEITAPPEYPTEHAQRGGHPWSSQYPLGPGSKRRRWNV